MVTVYAARSISVPMIANVVRMHARVTGATSAGASYSANDVALLSWVQATASFGFATAYSRYVRPLDRREFDAFYGEARPAARLYGALDSPASHAELHALLDSMLDRLEPSPVIFDFLRIMRDTPAIPTPFFRWLQRPLIRAAVEMIPHPIRERLGLGATHGLRPAERVLVRLAGAAADRMVLRECPASQSCLRLGLPANYLYA
jgi:uncharacterized protein (DUF2236 family)